MTDDWRLRVEDPDSAFPTRVLEELGQVELGGDGNQLLIYFDTAAEAWRAAGIVAKLVEVEGLGTGVTVERWHHESQEWQSATQQEGEENEFEDEGFASDFADEEPAVEEASEAWEVVVKLESRQAAREFASQATARGCSAKRRWRRLSFECAGQSAAEELASDLRMEVSPGTPIEVRRAAGVMPWSGGDGGHGGSGHAHHGGHHHGNGGGGNGGGGGGNGGGGGGNGG